MKKTQKKATPTAAPSLDEIFTSIFNNQKPVRICENCYTTLCDECGCSDYSGTLLELKAVLHRQDVILCHLSDQLTTEPVDWNRSLNLLMECRNLVKDGAKAIEASGHQF